jgi:hypothetical protein
MKRAFLLLIVTVSLLNSCGSKKIIPENEMVDILVKSFLSDATSISPHLSRPISKIDTINYYAWAYEPLGYTEQQFEEALTYYTSNPELLNKILDKVINELSRLETEMGTKLVTPEEAFGEASQNLWTDKTSWFLPSDGPQHADKFKIPSLGVGVYTLSAEVKVFADDESKNPRMTMFFYYDDGSQHGNRSSIKNVSYSKDGESRLVTIENILRNPDVTHIMGWVMDHSGQEGKWSKHAEVTNIFLKFTPLPPTIEIKKGLPRLTKGTDKSNEESK